MSIEEQIAAALRGRAAQRDFVDRLAESWEELAGVWAGLLAAAAGLGASAAGTRSTDRGESAVFSGLASYLGTDAKWRERAAAASEQIAGSADRVRTLQLRVHRQTVNIAVIGQTHAGKSTLLRKLTGLREEHIPSNRLTSTTATPSRIFHEPGTKPGRAVLTLHTWESFLAEVLKPLHGLAKIPGPPPTTLAEFERFPGYRSAPGQVAAGSAGAERYRGRLQVAQDSLPSYRNLLRGGIQQISLDQLRPFVAYPSDDDPRLEYRPYHAVRSIDIFCEFPQVGAVALGLVDLPGAGEAGLDVHGRFLSDLRNTADLLFLVKRPEMAPVTDPDWDARQLADDAAAGVRRSDFAHQIINRDSRVPAEFFNNALAQARVDGEKLGIEVRDCDIHSATPEEVAREILSPVVAVLAERLPIMDRDAAEEVLSDLTRITTEMGSLADELRQWIDRQRGLPDQEQRLHERSYDKKNKVGLALERLRDEYDRLLPSGEPIADLHQDIEASGQEMDGWLAGGLGRGSREAWLTSFREAEAVRGWGREAEERYNGAREQVVAVFEGIDASLGRAVKRLWSQVAAALRAELTEAIVPAEADSETALSAFKDLLEDAGAPTVADATQRLLRLRRDYGSIFLRVGRPIVRQIEWDPGRPGSQLGPAIAAAAAGAAVGAAAAGAPMAISQAVSAAAPHALQGTLGELAAELRERGQAAAGQIQQDWWRTVGRQASPSPAAGSPGPAGLSAAGGGSAPGGAGPQGAPQGSGEFARAEHWYGELDSTVRQVVGQLKQELHEEAQRTQRVLAAATEMFKDTATSTPRIEFEFAKICRSHQRQIWPDDFNGAAATIAADLAELRQRAAEASGAAAQVASLAGKASRL